jgi:hypothetical protein
MKRKRIFAAIAVTLGLLATPALARTNVDIDLNIGPPPLLVEEAPPPRVGFVWEPGHWEWRGHKHVWVKGHWLRARAGHAWEPAHWVEHDGRWRYVPGHWVPA